MTGVAQSRGPVSGSHISQFAAGLPVLSAVCSTDLQPHPQRAISFVLVGASGRWGAPPTSTHPPPPHAVDSNSVPCPALPFLIFSLHLPISFRRVNVAAGVVMARTRAQIQRQPLLAS